MAILTIEKSEHLAIVTIDDPGSKVNTLKEPLFEEFTAFLDDMGRDNMIRGAILISGKENNFVAGADIGIFPTLETASEFAELSRRGHAILGRIADSAKPIVACIHGSCLGGGAELALACHYRIISDHSDTKIGFPEVKLGLLPGMGGTQRLPRLIGIQQSLPYLLTGKNMYSRQALRTGFADEMVNRYNLAKAGESAVKMLFSQSYEREDKRPIYQKLLERYRPLRSVIFSQAEEKTRQKTQGNYPAPPAIIEAVRYGSENPLVRGLQNEARLFGKLAVTPESRELVRLFFATTKAKKSRIDAKPKQIGSIAVLGAGLMGSGIASVSLDGGYHVWLKDQTPEQAAGGDQVIHRELAEKKKKRIITDFEHDLSLSRLHPTASYDGFRTMDMVIEAVFEDLEVKRSVLKEVEKNTGPDCIFASNTSSLPISQIAEGARRPENVLGMHYFSPVQKMPLLEIIRTEKTADHVTATAHAIGVKQGKTVIVVNDGPGFYTTRILAAYINEALLLLEEGADIDELDKAMKQFGFPVGPVKLLDEIGIDVAAHVGKVMEETFTDRGGETSSLTRKLVAMGYKGKKNGTGFYTYEKDGKSGNVNTDIYTHVGAGGKNRKLIGIQRIQERLSSVMVNEALYCLQENILLSPEDGDIGAILGLGFPPFLGGPFRYVHNLGMDEFSDRLKRLQQAHGDRFKPADILSRPNGLY